MLVWLRALQAAPEAPTLSQVTKSPSGKVTAKIHPLESVGRSWKRAGIRPQVCYPHSQLSILSLAVTIVGLFQMVLSNFQSSLQWSWLKTPVRHRSLLLQSIFLAGKPDSQLRLDLLSCLSDRKVMVSAVLAPKLREPNQLGALAPFMA